MIIDDHSSTTQTHSPPTAVDQPVAITRSVWDQLTPRLAFRVGIVSALGVLSALGFISLLFLNYKNYL